MSKEDLVVTLKQKTINQRKFDAYLSSILRYAYQCQVFSLELPPLSEDTCDQVEALMGMQDFLTKIHSVKSEDHITIFHNVRYSNFNAMMYIYCGACDTYYRPNDDVIFENDT